MFYHCNTFVSVRCFSEDLMAAWISNGIGRIIKTDSEVSRPSFGSVRKFKILNNDIREDCSLQMLCKEKLVCALLSILTH